MVCSAFWSRVRLPPGGDVASASITAANVSLRRVERERCHVQVGCAGPVQELEGARAGSEAARAGAETVRAWSTGTQLTPQIARHAVAEKEPFHPLL